MATLTFDPSKAEERDLAERVIAVFKASQSQMPVSANTHGASDEELFWGNLSPRLGKDNLGLLCRKAAETGSFASLRELADSMGLPEAKVQSWRRNLGRSEAQANSACGTHLSVFVWDGAVSRYRVPPPLAEVILGGRQPSSRRPQAGPTTRPALAG
jgi:hypothetical protein